MHVIAFKRSDCVFFFLRAVHRNVKFTSRRNGRHGTFCITHTIHVSARSILGITRELDIALAV